MNLVCHLKKVAQTLSIFVISLFLFTVSAASLSLTSIGALSTGGASYAEWWYSGADPLLSGTAENDATVTVSVDGSEETVTADSSGNWTFQVFSTDDTAVILTSGSETYAFTLHLGQEFPGAGTTTETTETEETTAAVVPSTGYPQIFGLTLGTSMVLLGLYYFVNSKKSTKKAYIKDVLDSVE